MANKQAKFTYRGLNQDVTKSKHPFEFYYDSKNIRIINTDSQDSYSVTNEKGNTKVLDIPSIDITYDEQNGNRYNKLIKYNNIELPFVSDELIDNMPNSTNSQIIIGHAVTRDSIILLSTDDNGFDCVWEVTELLEGGFDLKLLYCRDLNFSTESPIQILYNYENDKIQKIYWVDGVNQLRFINIKHSIENGDIEELIDLNSTSINIVGDYNLSQVELLSSTGGGLNTSGMIQYAYNLYKLNGSQTRISPLSELISIDKGVNGGGGALNEKLGKVLTLKINELDERYTHIKIYAIKYTEFNQIPSISLIKDERIDLYTNYIFNDSGVPINDISLAEFLFLGSNPITPKHIESKDNRLFAANYSDNAYKLDVDMRAYSHDTSGSTTLFSGNVFYDNSLTGGNQLSYTGGTPITSYNYPITYDAINPNYDTFKYQKNGSIIGGEGLYIKYELLQKNESELSDSIKYLRFFKDLEIYRIGIIFYNKLGQKSDVKWIADFKTPEGNLEGNYNCIKIDIKQPDLDNYITSLNLSEDDKPTGYKIVRAERTIKDRTIVCQGSAAGMMIQTTDRADTNHWWNENNRNDESNKFVKSPLPISRGFARLPSERSVWELKHLQHMHNGPAGGNIWEFFREPDSDRGEGFRVQFAWQYNKMYQLYSPEITFDNGVSFDDGLEFSVKGLSVQTATNMDYKVININSKQYYGSNRRENITDYSQRRSSEHFFANGLFGPLESGCSNNTMAHYLFNTKYNNFIKSNSSASYSIYGIPEIAEKGQGVKFYNNDTTYKYNNTLEALLADGFNDEGCCCGGCDDEGSIRGINTWGARSLMIVEGEINKDENDRRSLNDLLTASGLPTQNGVLLLEVKRPISYIYNNGIYGGLSLENKSRVSYLEIGTYKNIDENTITIENAGDTYVQIFKIGRLLKTDTEDLDCRKQQLSEIIEFKVETSINLRNRNDLSLLDWDAKFQPRDDEFHEYNSVYSQSSNLIQNTTDNLNFKDNESFDTRIISSKLKVPGEIIDSWTDFLENEIKDVDGKYGPINSLVNLRDDIYYLQDKAVGKLSINPRVQTQASDGISIELGTGNVLYDYNYLSTESGTLNKWSVFTSPNSFYYLDLINKSFNKVSDRIHNLSSEKGLHAYFQNNLDFNILKHDNPILSKGVSGGYDTVNMDAFITCIQGDKTFTLNFNDKINQFESFWDFNPSRYINKGFKLLTPSPTNNNLYTHFEGEYNEFYDEYHPSYITLQLNPESDIDCIFDNIEYNSELYLDDIDQPEQTLTHIQAFNEYQNSGRIPLIVGRNKNLRRKFRKWKANIPRDGRNRIRNPWIFLKLELDNTSNYKLILHDIILNYTTP